MKKSRIIFLFLGIFILLSIFSLGFVSSTVVNVTSSSSSVVSVTSLKYEPYPVVPGDYFDFWLNINFLRNPRTEVTFELLESYPFSFDESTLKTYSGSVSSSILLNYRIRVDKDAIEGTNVITLAYELEGTRYIQEFEIEVGDSRTTFDAVIQDTSDSEVSIAIANTGKYSANSVVVRIPEQDSFTVSGTDGQMVGNLDSGDYTIVSFSLAQSMQRDSFESEASEGEFEKLSFGTEKQNLQFDIYYTDALGERRIVNMELPLTLNSLSLGEDSEFPEGFQDRGRKNSVFTSWYFFVFVFFLIVGIIFFIFYKKKPKQTKEFLEKIKQKFKKVFKKKKKSEGHDLNDITPEWMKKAKEAK